jgi:hypothetical protein
MKICVQFLPSKLIPRGFHETALVKVTKHESADKNSSAYLVSVRRFGRLIESLMFHEY